MLKIGLTGGIGSGKSSATKYFRSLGVPVIDADQVARAVVAPGQAALADIEQVFGAEAIDAGGELNRQWMRKRVFDDPKARDQLEAITHPRIKSRLLSEMAEQQNVSYIIVDIPLLVEKGYQDLFDAIIVVDCTPEQQLERVRQRDGSDEALIKGIMLAQASRARRLESASYVLDNSASLSVLYEQIDRLHAHLIQSAGAAI